MMKPYGVGVIGCGAISRTYLKNITERFSILKLIGVADSVPGRAEKTADEYGGRAMTSEELLNDPDVDIVVNLTSIPSHYEVTKTALEHGKHVYSEKMMADSFGRAKELYELAKEKNLRIAVAPDTCLGGGYQTVRKLLDDGVIGTPLAATAAVVRGYLPAGPESGWLSNVFCPGGTIPYDMGSYFINALLTIFGPVKRVSGFAASTKKYFTPPANPNYGQELVIDDPDSPNLMQAAMEFESGVLATLTAADAGTMLFPEEGITIYGTKGRLICPDPDLFGGEIKLCVAGEQEYRVIPMLHGYSGQETAFLPVPENEDPRDVIWRHSRRGIGVAELAWALRNGRPQRLSNEMGLHAIEIVYGAATASRTGVYYTMTTPMEKMKPLRPGFIGPDAEAVFDD